MTRLSSQEVDDQAAEWAVRLDAGSLGPEEQAALSAWLDADVRHFGSFAKARAVLAHSDRARALGPSFDPSGFNTDAAAQTDASLPREERRSRRRVLLGGGMAASLAVLGGAVALGPHLLTGQRYNTRLGESRVVPLEDGSIITLNTDSEIAVNFTPQRRDVRLIRGEVLFDVAKNKQRPFIVNADGTTVRAVGTSFTVSLLPDRPVQVLVREGKVEVKRPDVIVAPAVYVTANTKVVAPADAPIETRAVAPAEVVRELSWRVGRLSFEGESLADAAATFSRYSEIKIQIDDPEVARQSVTGLFVSNDPVGFSKAVALSLGLHAEVTNSTVRLTR